MNWMSSHQTPGVQVIGHEKHGCHLSDESHNTAGLSSNTLSASMITKKMNLTNLAITFDGAFETALSLLSHLGASLASSRVNKSKRHSLW